MFITAAGQLFACSNGVFLLCISQLLANCLFVVLLCISQLLANCLSIFVGRYYTVPIEFHGVMTWCCMCLRTFVSPSVTKSHWNQAVGPRSVNCCILVLYDERSWQTNQGKSTPAFSIIFKVKFWEILWKLNSIMAKIRSAFLACSCVSTSDVRSSNISKIIDVLDLKFQLLNLYCICNCFKAAELRDVIVICKSTKVVRP